MRLDDNRVHKGKITPNGVLLIGSNSYRKIKCKRCGQLCWNQRDEGYCERSCSAKDVSQETRNTLSRKNTGKKHSQETKDILSLKAKDQWISMTPEQKLIHSERGRQLRKRFHNGTIVPLYDTYHPQISWCEETRRDPDNSVILQVRCKYCGKWYTPSISDMSNRTGSLNGRISGDNHFYCSNHCKSLCPIYRKRKYIRGYEKDNDRPIQPELRKMVFERDNWTCTKCGTIEKLHCHHIDPVQGNPIESTDMDNCITLCSECHHGVHRIPGCGRLEFCGSV